MTEERQGHSYVETAHGERILIHECAIPTAHDGQCVCWCGHDGEPNSGEELRIRQAWGAPMYGCDRLAVLRATLALVEEVEGHDGQL